ncbi:GTPase HflX [bacterium]|jgi:GTP-binding protein HflX|nr:GTPase HflX [Verrucomicrobiales bacterium]MDB4467901.1 GTPase HflX [Verrucomicrobiales bacterium]MDB4507645.1 GTPase HflX [bacterium]MDC0504132.1 GTPase HflX [Verrucomicrobiales bacterium]MDF1784765.1 GTPase HflX [Verrucomicrobiales bacterium]
MFEIRDKPNMVERALLVGVYFDKHEADEAESLLDELRELVKTLGIGVVDQLLVRVPKSHARYLMGTGKTEEVIDVAKDLECDCIIFDNELTPAQQRAWEQDSNICVIDRQEVILDIFNVRAQTKEARLQVQLARMEYSLPRLARMWTHLDRQGGGVGARGEGEKQLETDRRLARKRIDRVKAQLEEVRKQRTTQRKERERMPLPHASIVGYTNAGKSTLLNRLTGSSVLAEDMLFATLDTTTRRIELPDGQPLLLTDTVGFIRRLPHRLVEAFKATLEEALLADFLIHLLDASDPEVLATYTTTQEVLAELGAEEKRKLLVFNKVDLVEDNAMRRELEGRFPDACFISAGTGEGLENLQNRMSTMLAGRVHRLQLRIPQSRHDVVTRLHRDGKIISTDYEGQDVLLQAVIPKAMQDLVTPFIDSEATPTAME